MLRTAVASLLLLLPTGLTAESFAVVHLRNGDLLSGHIVAESPTAITFVTDRNARLHIPASAIRSLERRKPSPNKRPPAPPVENASRPPNAAPTTPAAKTAGLPQMTLLPPPEKTNAPPVSSPPPPATVAPPPAKSKPVAKAPSPVKAEDKPAAKKPTKAAVKKPAPKAKWTHDVRLGLDLRYSAVTQQTVHSRYKTTYSSKQFRNQTDWNFAYGKTEKAVSADRMSGLAKTDWTFGVDWYVYNIGSAGYDIVRRVALQYEVGPGIGYHLVKGQKFLFEKSKFSFDLEAGAEYEDKQSTTDRSTQRRFLRLGQIVKWVINDDLTLTEEFYFYPRIGGLKNNRYRGEANIAYRLVKNLDLNLTVLAEADPQHLSDFVADDLQIRSSLGWRF